MLQRKACENYRIFLKKKNRKRQYSGEQYRKLFIEK